jgi:hypothetical protein
MELDSPYYWLGVAACSIAFALVVRVVLSRREDRRGYPAAVVVYVLAWVAFTTYFGTRLLRGIPVGPGWPIWTFPLAQTLGVLAVFGGGHGLAGLFGLGTRLRHPEARTRAPHIPEHELTDAELLVAQTYDDTWQAQDRKRNQALRAKRTRRRKPRPGV